MHQLCGQQRGMHIPKSYWKKERALSAVREGTRDPSEAYAGLGGQGNSAERYASPYLTVSCLQYSPAKARREEDSQFLCLQKLNPFPIEHPAPIFSDVPCLCEASASVLDDSEDDGEVVRPHPNIAILRMAATAPEHAHRWHGQGSGQLQFPRIQFTCRQCTGLSLLYTAHEIKQQVAKPEDNRLELRPLQPLTPWERSCVRLPLTIIFVCHKI